MKDTETVTLDKALKGLHSPHCQSKAFTPRADIQLACDCQVVLAKASLIKLFESAIGEDEPVDPEKFDNNNEAIRNQLRIRQRQRLQALSNSEKAEE